MIYKRNLATGLYVREFKFDWAFTSERGFILYETFTRNSKEYEELLTFVIENTTGYWSVRTALTTIYFQFQSIDDALIVKIYDGGDINNGVSRE